LILDDLGNPAPAKVGRALGVTERTVQRWLADEQAPRAATLALFWLTRWGSDAVTVDARNMASMYASQVAGLRAEIDRLRHELARVVHLADFGTANAPVLDLLPVPEARPPAPRLQLVVA
jgi:hypothetical protein